MELLLQKKKKLLEVVCIHCRTGVLGGILVAIIVFALFLNKVNNIILISLLSLTVLVRLLQLHYTKAGFLQDIEEKQINHTFRMFILLTTIAGLAWGITSIYLISHTELSYAVLIIIIVEAMIAAAVGGYAIYPQLFFTLSYPSAIPVAIYLLSQSDKFYILHGSFMLIFLAFMTAVTLRLHKQLKQSIDYQFENLLLFEQIKEEKSKIEALASNLLELSKLDGLTNIANRRAFDEIIGAEWSRMMRAGKPLSLIMCDIDFFKNYNDNYGHQKGDECLIVIAGVLQDFARRSGDTAARYGGEEFTIVLPETTIENAAIIAGQIKEKINQLQIPHEYSEVSDVVTVSFGISTIVPVLDIELAEFINKVDQLLYKAKELGRNQIVAEAFSFGENSTDINSHTSSV